MSAVNRICMTTLGTLVFASVSAGAVHAKITIVHNCADGSTQKVSHFFNDLEYFECYGKEPEFESPPSISMALPEVNDTPRWVLGFSDVESTSMNFNFADQGLLPISVGEPVQ